MQRACADQRIQKITQVAVLFWFVFVVLVDTAVVFVVAKSMRPGCMSFCVLPCPSAYLPFLRQNIKKANAYGTRQASSLGKSWTKQSRSTGKLTASPDLRGLHQHAMSYRHSSKNCMRKRSTTDPLACWPTKDPFAHPLRNIP